MTLRVFQKDITGHAISGLGDHVSLQYGFYLSFTFAWQNRGEVNQGIGIPDNTELRGVDRTRGMMISDDLYN